jgi:hypothetical protein
MRFVYDASVRRLADQKTRAKEFETVGAAIDFLWPALEAAGYTESADVIGVKNNRNIATFKLSAGEGIVIDGHEYKVKQRDADQ